MTIGIMQPYIFPYIGYFQLINAVDKFVVYDNIEYTKKGWINRNRILLNGADYLFSLPLKKDSDFLTINKRYLADNFVDYKKKILGQIRSAYVKSPEFKAVNPLIEECFNFANHNLFEFIFNSLKEICKFLNINTQFIVSSSLNIDHSLKSEKKILEINRYLKASVYINAIGGKELYSKETFTQNGIQLKFIRTNPVVYTQFSNEFISYLSIIDVLMFNNREKIKEYLNSSYTLL